MVPSCTVSRCQVSRFQSPRLRLYCRRIDFTVKLCHAVTLQCVTYVANSRGYSVRRGSDRSIGSTLSSRANCQHAKPHATGCSDLRFITLDTSVANCVYFTCFYSSEMTVCQYYIEKTAHSLFHVV